MGYWKGMTVEAKSFHIGDIISITSGQLVPLDHTGRVSKLLDWMTGDELMTHQRPRVCEECALTLIAAFPDLDKITVPAVTSMAVIETWFDQLSRDGVSMRRDVPKVAGDAHARIDAILELQRSPYRTVV